MSAPVDVLAIMLAAANGGCEQGPMRKAHDAVAELVAADRELDEIRLLPAQPEPVADYHTRLSAAWARRAAALARFGGAA
jgi:hypothetical protein